jgi:hypothetical protein
MKPIAGLGAALLLAASLAAAGCGGGGSATAAGVPTGHEVITCLAEGGGMREHLVPQRPKGPPKVKQVAFGIGPTGGHLYFYLSQRPVYTAAVAKGFDEIGEFQAEIARGGRVLILHAVPYAAADRRLAHECVSPG